MSIEDRKEYIGRCPRCSQCKWMPSPRSQQFAPVCPSIQFGNFHSYSASGKGFTAYGLAEKRIGYSPELLRSVYACTMCGACDSACKTNQGDNVEPLDTLYELRAHIVADGQALPEHRAMVDSLVTYGNSLGMPRKERARFADGLAIKDATSEAVGVLLYVGSAAAYDQDQWPALRFAISAMTRAGIDVGFLGNAEIDSGGLAFDIGFREEALLLARQVAALVADSKAHTLVTFDADALAAFRNLYVRMGVSLGDVRIVHISDYLLELIESGAIVFDLEGERTVTYHDPCKLGRLSEPYEPWNGTWQTVLNVVHIAEPPRRVRYGTGGVYDAPRALIGKVRGARLVEMERNREFAYCCGAGAGAADAYPDFARQAGGDRLAEAEATGASVLVTSCAGCQRHLQEVARARGSALEVKGLLDFLIGASVPQSQATS